MTTTNLPAVSAQAEPVTLPDDPDGKLVMAWLRRHESAHTRRAYGRTANRFRAIVAKPLADVRLVDLQDYLDTLAGLAPASRAVAIATLKSLLSFAHELGYVPVNAGKLLKAPSVKNVLAERIMPETDALVMVRMEPDARNRALLTLAYGGGLRLSEICGLRWRDLAAREGDAGQATVFGKGGRTRAILLSTNTWKALAGIHGGASPDDPVFRSRRGGPLTPSAVHRVVKAAAARAGLSADVSAHWLRHAHASHSLDRGAPIHLVQATLGHASVATTGRYTHARPSDSSARYLGV